MNKKTYFIAGAVALFLGVVFFMAAQKKDDERIYGIWVVPDPRSKYGLDFGRDGVAKPVQLGSEINPVKDYKFDFWTDRNGRLHVFQAESDNGAWKDAPYKIEGNKLILEEELFYRLPKEFVRAQ